MATTMLMRSQKGVKSELAIEYLKDRCSDTYNRFKALRDLLRRMSPDGEAPQETQMAIDENVIPRGEKRDLSPEMEMSDERRVRMV